MSSNENFAECKIGRAGLKDLEGKPLEAKYIDAIVNWIYKHDTECALPYASSWGHDADDDSPLPPAPLPSEITDRLDFLINVMKIADMYNIRSLTQQVFEHLQSWIKATHTGVPHKPNGIIEYILDAAVEQIGSLHASEGDGGVLERYPELAKEVLTELGRGQYERIKRRKARIARRATPGYVQSGWSSGESN